MINNLSEFYDISIRGRVAYSLCCLNNLVTNLKCDNRQVEFLFDRLWKYLNLRYLDEWHMELSEFIPDVIMKCEQYDENEFEFITSEMFSQLKLFYSNADKDILESINLIFYIGTIELYGKVQKKGKSFEYLECLIRILTDRQIMLPNINLFIKYEFNMSEGWGDLISPDEIRSS